MSKSMPTVLTLAACAAMIGGWFALALETGAEKKAEAMEAATVEACAHEKGFGSGLANYLPSPDLKLAPQSTFLTANGDPISLADFKRQGLVVNFWATWCAPCVAEMPALDRLNADMEDDGIKVIAISEDRNWQDAAPRFYEETDLQSLEIFADENMAFARESGVSGLPTTLLINPDGHEVAAVLGPAEWDSPEIAEFLKSCLIGQG